MTESAEQMPHLTQTRGASYWLATMALALWTQYWIDSGFEKQGPSSTGESRPNGSFKMKTRKVGLEALTRERWEEKGQKTQEEVCRAHAGSVDVSIWVLMFCFFGFVFFKGKSRWKVTTQEPTNCVRGNKSGSGECSCAGDRSG